jgi:3-methyl-2-oxobutanoate hydroxymethyltransferase
MSMQSIIKRKTAPDIRARRGGEPIVTLTSYHAHTAALVDHVTSFWSATRLTT